MTYLKNKDRIKPFLGISTQLESDRVILRKYQTGDGQALLELLNRNNNREFLKDEMQEAEQIKDVADADAHLQSLEADFLACNRFVMGIWLKEEGIFIGEIWIEPKSPQIPSYEIGYYIDHGYTRKGLATEAAKTAIDFIFEELAAHKIVITTKDYNIPSFKVAEKLQFKREAHFRENQKENNKRFGQYFYGLLRSEYQQMQ